MLWLARSEFAVVQKKFKCKLWIDSHTVCNYCLSNVRAVCVSLFLSFVSFQWVLCSEIQWTMYTCDGAVKVQKDFRLIRRNCGFQVVFFFDFHSICLYLLAMTIHSKLAITTSQQTLNSMHLKHLRWTYLCRCSFIDFGLASGLRLLRMASIQHPTLLCFFSESLEVFAWFVQHKTAAKTMPSTVCADNIG